MGTPSSLSGNSEGDYKTLGSRMKGIMAKGKGQGLVSQPAFSCILRRIKSPESSCVPSLKATLRYLHLSQ